MALIIATTLGSGPTLHRGATSRAGGAALLLVTGLEA
jgi:hypothetical protein